MDVIESEAGIEIVVDLPGIKADAVSITSPTARSSSPATSGQRAATRARPRSISPSAVSVASRAVQLGGAFDTGRARATLVAGELRIVLPRIDERRGRRRRLPSRSHVRTAPERERCGFCSSGIFSGSLAARSRGGPSRRS